MDLGSLFAGALFVGLLLSGDGTVPVPNGDWGDDVGKSIKRSVNSCIGSYNSALKDFNSAVLGVKYKAESKALEVNFASKRSDLEWWAGKINAIKINNIIDEVNRI